MKLLIRTTVCAVLTLGKPLLAQGAPELLELSVDRTLTTFELQILSGVLEVDAASVIAGGLGYEAPTLEQACGGDAACVLGIRDRYMSAEALANALPQGSDRNVVLDWTGNIVIDRPLPGLPADSTVISNVAPPSAVPDLRAVPLDNFGTYASGVDFGPDSPRIVGNDVTHGVEGGELTKRIGPPLSPATRLIEADIARFGSSRRTFAIRRDVPTKELTAALELLNRFGLQASRLPEDTEPSASLIEPLDVVTFEAAPNAVENCVKDAVGRSWPFDEAPVVEVLRDNLRIMANLRLPVERALIVVADTGLGKGAVDAGGGGFFDLLAPNAPELLNPLVTYRSDNGRPGSTACTDHDNNSYFGDVYGATGSDLNTRDRCLQTADRHKFDSRLIPISRRAGAIETYEPSHGSFVATLAVGGIDLLNAYPEISRQIGLRVFKTTRETEQTSTKSVRVDPTDIIGAIKYAIAQDAAVLNMSMKTTDDLTKLFRDEVDNANTLVVVSAGNRQESLDQQASGVYPAGLISDHLIVVGGLDNDADHSWWTNSAFGETHVEIAAPAVRVRSLDEHGNNVCYTGTSAAAPIVSFTSAVLLSYGILDARGTKSRILGAAAMERDGSLNGKVKNGRRLDVAAALDIFYDRVTTADGTLRGRILSPLPSARLLSICAPSDPELAATSGRMDPANLVSWVRSGDQAAFAVRGTENRLGHCRLPEGVSLSFQTTGTASAVPIPMKEVTSIVFSSFRSDDVQDAVFLGN